MIETPATSDRSGLHLARPLQEQLERWALAEYPREACGLLIGRQWEGWVEVLAVHRGKNRAGARGRERFDLDPGDHKAAEDEALARGLAVVGLWHTHPDEEARPSGLDRAGAQEGWSYVILSVARGRVRELRSWRLAHGRMEEELLLA